MSLELGTNRQLTAVILMPPDRSSLQRIWSEANIEISDQGGDCSGGGPHESSHSVPSYRSGPQSALASHRPIATALTALHRPRSVAETDGGMGSVTVVPNSLTTGRSEPGEVTGEISQLILFKEFWKFSLTPTKQARSGQMPISPLFALSATETKLITAANPSFAKRFPNWWRR